MVSRSTQTSQLDIRDLQLAKLLQAQDGLIGKCVQTLNTLDGEICRSKKVFLNLMKEFKSVCQ